MTDNASSLAATCQQTRFQIREARHNPEASRLTAEQLTVSILPPGINGPGKSRAKVTKAIDIVADASLKLKSGVHYGLLGRNGCGKSTLLQAIASKIIPAIPHSTKIALLQQTASGDENTTVMPIGSEPLRKGALQFILEGDVVKNEIQEELNILSSSVLDGEGSDWAQIRAYRKLMCIRMQRRLAGVQKNAALRSGARGSQARRELLAFEKQIAEAMDNMHSKEPPLDSKTCQKELILASQLMAGLQLELAERQASDLEARGLNILRCLGFSDQKMQTPLGELSGGWQMRCMLANALLQDVDFLFLDEPTNFLDLLGIIWLQGYLVKLRAESKTVVVVSHDRDFIDKVCEEIVILKEKSLVYFVGNLSTYEQDMASRRHNLSRLKDAQNKQIAHMEKTIAANIKVGKKTGDDNKLRQAASRKKKIEDRSGMQTNEKGGKFKLSRDHAGFQDSKRKAIDIPPQEKTTSLKLPLAPDLRFPGPLISLEKATFAYGPKQDPVLRDVGLSIYMGDRIGILGLNGSGKSTLIKLVTGSLEPARGTAIRHPRLKLGYYSQLAVDELRAAGTADESMTALSVLAALASDEMDEGEMRGLLGSFHLPGRIASDVPVSKLSGGQLVRLAMACVVWNHPHLLVLDEITTHLDFYTVIALSKALRKFNGALLVVSHDRFLMRSVIEGDTERLHLDDEDELESEEEEKAELQRSLFRLSNAKLVRLEKGVRAYEESLEKKVAKLAI